MKARHQPTPAILLSPFAASATLTENHKANIPQEVITPPVVETSIGDLHFNDGMPSVETANKIYDQLDFIRGVETYLNALPAVSMFAIRKGFREAGVKDNDVIIFSGLMDSQSLFLTANCDTIYFWTYLDLSKGPIVVEVPAEVLALADDMWFRWIIDLGLPGPDRGMGGKYIFVPPGYNGSLPEGGYFIGRSRTKSIGILGRAFLDNNDPKPAAVRIKSGLKIYPYTPGSYGSSVGSFLAGKGPWER